MIDLLQQFGGAERLLHETGVFHPRYPPAFIRRYAGGEDDGQKAACRLQRIGAFTERFTVHPRHVDIRDDGIGLFRVDHPKSFLTVSCRKHIVTAVFKLQLNHLSNGNVVIYDEDSRIDSQGRTPLSGA